MLKQAYFLALEADPTLPASNGDTTTTKPADGGAGAAATSSTAMFHGGENATSVTAAGNANDRVRRDVCMHDIAKEIYRATCHTWLVFAFHDCGRWPVHGQRVSQATSRRIFRLLRLLEDRSFSV